MAGLTVLLDYIRHPPMFFLKYQLLLCLGVIIVGGAIMVFSLRPSTSSKKDWMGDSAPRWTGGGPIDAPVTNPLTLLQILLTISLVMISVGVVAIATWKACQ